MKSFQRSAFSSQLLPSAGVRFLLRTVIVTNSDKRQGLYQRSDTPLFRKEKLEGGG
jgi:hypothetical protein